jgi:2-polyprenyl-3-methyl-5-hydroxy-6-metoxy-1,4-benzoquinol methylase
MVARWTTRHCEDNKMSFFPNLSRRQRQPEIMDQPGLDSGRHAQALRGLERVNFWSGSARTLWSPILSLARKTGAPCLRILDVATGAGDVPIALWRKAQAAGLRLQIDACDVNPRAVQYSQRQAAQEKANVRFFELDALRDPLPGGYDVVVSSLFLHHLDEAEAIELLGRMAAGARRMVLVNDLVRSPAGFFLAYVGTRLLTTSEVARLDGPRSVEGTFTLEEVRDLAKRAGLWGVTVEECWPCRLLLKWEQS